MRIGGLASGIDTESIIRDMMKAHRIPLDKITQKKAYTTWQMDDYRSTNRDLRKQGDKLFDTVMKEGTYSQKKVSVSDEKSVSITSKNASSDFSGTIEITKLAKQATLQSGGTLKQGGASAKVEGETLITSEQASKSSLLELGLFGGGSSEKQTITITVPGKEPTDIDVKPEDTMNSVMKKINEKTGANAFYDAQSGRIAMSAKESGVGEIVVADKNGGNLAATLGLSNIGGSHPTADSQSGDDAVFNFNGLVTSRSSNTFDINGFEINLKQVTTSPVTFSSTADTDKIVDSLKGFVDDYNKMIEELNSKIKEKNFRDFPPLSAEQKADMKEKEIELWEEKAKSGTMRNDPTISTMLNKLRGIMTKTVNTTDKDGKPLEISLKDIGIETSKNYSENGKLTINEDILRAKISENPNAVYDLIGRDDKEDTKNSGIAQDYRKELQAAQKNISEKAGSSTAVNDSFALGRSLKSMDKQIERFENKLEMMESRYWKQFNAMERAIQRANAQSAQLMSSLGGGM